MLPEPRHHKPSKTAMLAAFHRALAHLEYNSKSHGPDNLSPLFLPPIKRFILNFKLTRTLAKSKLKKMLPGMDELMIARTAFYDKLFKAALEKEFPQIVLLGAGYDTRAIRFAHLNKTTKIIELDGFSTQDSKKQCLEKANIHLPEQLTFAPVDFNQDSLDQPLTKAGYDCHQKTLFIWEGVTMYLEADSVDSTLEFVTRFSNPDSVIAFDYMVTVPPEKANQWHGLNELLQTMKKQYGNEKFIFSVEPGKIDSFLKQRGLKVIDHLDNKGLENKFLIRKDGSLIGKMMAAYEVVAAAPART